MNTQKKAKANTVITRDQVPTPTQYAMRVECASDAIVSWVVLAPWVVEWRQARSAIEGVDGKPHFIPDLDIEFTVGENAPTLVEMRWLLNCVADLHVAAQSLNLASAYDGGRVSYEEVEKGQPLQTVIQQVHKRLAGSGATWSGLIGAFRGDGTEA